MTSDFKAVVACLFETIWKLFTSWNVPGTNVSPAEMGLFFIAAGIGLRFVFGFLTGNRAGAASALSDRQYSQNQKLQEHLQNMEIRSINKK